VWILSVWIAAAAAASVAAASVAAAVVVRSVEGVRAGFKAEDDISVGVAASFCARICDASTPQYRAAMRKRKDISNQEKEGGIKSAASRINM